MSDDQEIVVVGEKLGVIEEFLPGPGTIENNGDILATITGKKHVDRERLVVSVKPIVPMKRVMPKVGDVVIAEVFMTRKQIAACNIFKVRNHFMFEPARGTLHVSKMSNRYLRTAEDGFRTTDIIRAKIVDKNFTEFELSTDGPHLGVIYAECVFCGHPLELKGPNVVCTRCHYPNSRKIARDYGKVRERIENI